MPFAGRVTCGESRAERLAEFICYQGVSLLGAGKDPAHHNKIDYAVGVSEIKKVGTQVKQGEPLMMIHYNDEAKLEQALEYFKNAYRLAPKRPTPPPLIVERVA